MRTYYIAHANTNRTARFNGEIQLFKTHKEALQFVKEWCAEKLYQAGENQARSYEEFYIFNEDSATNSVFTFNNFLYWFVNLSTVTRINMDCHTIDNIDNTLELFVSRFLQFYSIRYYYTTP